MHSHYKSYCLLTEKNPPKLPGIFTVFFPKLPNILISSQHFWYKTLYLTCTPRVVWAEGGGRGIAFLGFIYSGFTIQSWLNWASLGAESQPRTGTVHGGSSSLAPHHGRAQVVPSPTAGRGIPDFSSDFSEDFITFCKIPVDYATFSLQTSRIVLLAFAGVHKASKAFQRVIPTGEPALGVALLWEELQ